MNVKEMSDEGLSKTNEELQIQWGGLRMRMREVTAELNRRTNERAAKEALARLNPAQRAALAQVIKAEGVESGEAVGTPGGA